MISTILIILIILLFPPAGVAIVAGCGADLCINILLTILGFFPGHIHAFYILYVYTKRREQARAGVYLAPAAGVYSDRVQAGGKDYVANYPPPPQQAGYGTMPPQQV